MFSNLRTALTNVAIKPRFFSSKPLPVDKDLKLALNSLYKLVHPDFYESHPEAKASNDKSFKLLQEYVDLTRKGFEGRRPLVEYQFNFYVWQDALEKTAGSKKDVGNSEADSDPEERTQDDSRQAQKISVNLPPPQKGSSYKNRHAFKKLFVACGVPFNPTSPRGLEGHEDAATSGAARGHVKEDGGWEDETSSTSNLRDHERETLAFMEDAAEAIAATMSSDRVKSPHVRVPYLRAAMRHSRGLMVSFKAPDLVPGSKQVELLERLVKILEAEEEDIWDLDFSGQHVVIGDWLGLDPFGHLCLHMDRPDEWVDFLLGVDLEFALQRRQSVESLRHLEARVAVAVGLWLVCAEPHEATRDRYRAFLAGLANAASERGTIRSLNGVTLTVRSPESVPLGVGPSSCWIEPERACVATTAAAAPAAVYDWLMTHGAGAAAEIAAKRGNDKLLQDLLVKTRKDLGLRFLSYSRELTEPQVRSACEALLRVAGPARFRVEGSAIRIGVCNQIRKEDFEIELAWNAL